MRNRTSVALGAATAAGIVASVSLGVGYVHYERLATAEQAALKRSERANADLQDALARLRDQFGAANQALGSAQGRIATLSDEAKRQITVSEQTATSKTDRISQLSYTLDQAQRELRLTEAQRVTLMARLSKAENDLAEGQNRQLQAQAGADQWQKKVHQLSADRDRAVGERDQLRARIGDLEQKLSLLQTRQTPRPVAEAHPAPGTPAQATPTPAAPVAAAPAADPATQMQAAVAQPVIAQPVVAQPPVAYATPAPAAMQAVVEPARATPPVAVAGGARGLAQVERVLASAGVDVAHLFAQYGVRTGQGGPFIPAPRGTHSEPTMSPEKLAALSRLVKVLPVAAPLQSYEVGSSFGVRGDPMNGRSSYHTGIDLLAPYMSPVYATAPGVVTYSGYRADYGKVVEIDHGNGMSTRYAHLHRATVSFGQRLGDNAQIGFLGSTGRTTGPHVHYEILVNGEPQDPTKFLGLGRVVRVAHQ